MDLETLEMFSLLVFGFFDGTFDLLTVGGDLLKVPSWLDLKGEKSDAGIDEMSGYKRPLPDICDFFCVLEGPLSRPFNPGDSNWTGGEGGGGGGRAPGDT